MRPYWLLSILAGLSLLAIMFALLSGSVAVPLDELFSSPIVVELRLPRVLVAYSCGALLAQAGVLMQVLVRNPLADPYILGISGGSATAVLLSILVGVTSSLGQTSSAFAGALLATLLVFMLAHRQGSWTPTRLLLTGVVIAAGWGACISLILAIAPAASIHGMLFWLMGDLSYASSSSLPAIVLLGGLLIALYLAPQLNVMIRGETLAMTVGVNTQSLNLKIYLLTAVLTATAVVQAGSIGFVGFIVPHLIRLLGVNDHRLLLPAALLAGGSLVVLADTVARSVIAPQQLPVGIITALIGIPLFLFLLQRDSYRA